MNSVKILCDITNYNILNPIAAIKLLAVLKLNCEKMLFHFFVCSTHFKIWSGIFLSQSYVCGCKFK